MKRLNSNDIARLAGVSRSTVSRVINNYPNVPDHTRDRVMAVIRENHYYPQLSGQMLNGMRNNTIGLFWLSRTTIAEDALSSSFLVHVIDAATERGYLVLSCILDGLTDRGSADFVRRTFLEGRIDGGVFIGAGRAEPLVGELAEMGKIVGLFDYRPDDAPGCLTVNYERDTGEKAVDYLCALGHRDIAVIDGNRSRYCCEQRRESCLRGMERHGLSLRGEWLLPGGIAYSDGYRAVKRLLEDRGGPLPTALVAANDSAAFGAYQACREAGLRVPDDLSVIGADGHMNAEKASPPLTTFAFDFKRMFDSLVDRVIDRIEQKEAVASDETFASELIERQSCRSLTE